MGHRQYDKFTMPAILFSPPNRNRIPSPRVASTIKHYMVPLPFGRFQYSRYLGDKFYFHTLVTMRPGPGCGPTFENSQAVVTKSFFMPERSDYDIIVVGVVGRKRRPSTRPTKLNRRRHESIRAIPDAVCSMPVVNNPLSVFDLTESLNHIAFPNQNLLRTIRKRKQAGDGTTGIQHCLDVCRDIILSIHWFLNFFPYADTSSMSTHRALQPGEPLISRSNRSSAVTSLLLSESPDPI